MNTFTLLYKSKCCNAKYTAIEVERKRYSKKDKKERKGIKRKKIECKLRKEGCYRKRDQERRG